MEIIKVNDKKAISVAIKVIKNGGVVICPTDTVYGFLADASNKKAVDKIFKLKKRPRSKPLPVFIKDFKMAKELAEINEEQEKIQVKYWPGKFTFVLKRKKLCEGGAHTKAHTKLYGIDKNKIALRIPKYKFLNDLLKKVNKPLVQTSVNISGQTALTRINDILEKFARFDPAMLIIDTGNLPKGKPSIIINLLKDKIKVLRK